MGKLKDLAGRRFGRLTPIEYVGSKKWKCICDCGNTTIVMTNNLRNGGTKSCGCLKKEIKLTNNLKPTEYEIDGDTAICYTSSGAPFYIDKEDIDIISNRSWRVDTRGYISGRYNGKFINLHRYILGVDDPKVFVDHMDRNKLNNRKNNLRLCNRAQNQRNYNQRADNTSGFSGVYWNTHNKRWKAMIHFNKKAYYLGCFDNYEDAVWARYYAELECYEEFAPHTYQDVINAVQQYKIICTGKGWN